MQTITTSWITLRSCSKIHDLVHNDKVKMKYGLTCKTIEGYETLYAHRKTFEGKQTAGVLVAAYGSNQ